MSAVADLHPAYPGAKRDDAGAANGGLPDFAWVLCLVWLAAIVVMQSVFFRLHMPYDQTPDQDVVLVYNALLLNEGMHQEFFDHTGYVIFLLLASWYRLLGWLGFLPVTRFGVLPRVADIAAYETAWQGLVEAGRLFTAMVIAAAAVLFAGLAARLLRDRRIGLFAGLALATGMGEQTQLGIMRTDTLSAFFVVAALMLALVAASGPSPRARFLFVGLAGFAAVMAVLTKVFAILPLMALPPLAIAFGKAADRDAERENAPRRALVLAAVAVVAAIPAGFLVFVGFSQVAAAPYPYHPIGGGILGFYQGWLVIWVIGCIALYARVWRAPVADAVSAGAALAIGVSLGLATIFFRYEVQNAVVTLHPIEQLFVFSTWSDPSLAQQSSVLGGGLMSKLAAAAVAVVTRRFTDPAADNLLVFEVLVVAGLAGGIWFRDRRWAIEAVLLFLVSWGLQAVFLVRYEQLTYHVFSDPFTILAGAVVLARFRRVLLGTAASVGVVAGLIVYVWWGMDFGSRWSPARDQGNICAAHEQYMRQLERFPFCPP